MSGFLILGAGFTAGRVARRLVESGAEVTVTNRQPLDLPGARCLALDVTAAASLRELRPQVSDGMVILHSIPTFGGTPELVELLRSLRPARVVYLSTTGVYGPAAAVDEHTVPDPQTDKDRQRVQAERVLADGPWTTLVLRPAAIYGPRRGVHWSVRQGTMRPSPGNPIISRIHVEDLAEHALHALRSDATGAYPVADEEPCPSVEVAEWTLARLGIAFTASRNEPSRGGRRVNGAAVRDLLGIRLRYRSYREGVAACLDEEGAVRAAR